MGASVETNIAKLYPSQRLFSFVTNLLQFSAISRTGFPVGLKMIMTDIIKPCSAYLSILIIKMLISPKYATVPLYSF